MVSPHQDFLSSLLWEIKPYTWEISLAQNLHSRQAIFRLSSSVPVRRLKSAELQTNASKTNEMIRGCLRHSSQEENSSADAGSRKLVSRISTEEAFMRYFRRTVFLLLFCIVPGSAHAQQAVNLQGAWELVSQKEDGKDHPISGRQIKLVTLLITHGSARIRNNLKRNWPGELCAIRLPRIRIILEPDSYKVDGDTYTETTEFFYAPQYIGTSLAFKFKLDGGFGILRDISCIREG